MVVPWREAEVTTATNWTLGLVESHGLMAKQSLMVIEMFIAAGKVQRNNGKV